MTEAEWLSCNDPVAMLAYLDRPRGNRKLRLFAVACCRDHWQLLPNKASRDGVDWAERFADGNAAHDKEYERLEWACEGAFFYYDYQRSRASEIADEEGKIEDLAEAAYFANTVMCFDQCDPYCPDFHQHRRMLSVNLTHDVFGNPFRPVTFDPTWRTETAVALSRQMYESRDFSAMPILVDALQDAGCECDEVLTHCRDPKGIHVRGCWVVDLVLEKS